jgi:hypothetical protein
MWFFNEHQSYINPLPQRIASGLLSYVSKQVSQSSTKLLGLLQKQMMMCVWYAR